MPVTRVLRVDTRDPEPEAVATAAACMREGGMVAFPTESFYGLGVPALDGRSILRVFRVKGRPESKPLLALVDSIRMAEALCAEIPPGARALMARYWPGPLTLVLRAGSGVPEALTARTGTVGVRMPAHAVALALVQALRAPVTAPSANPSGAPPPVTAEDVLRYFQGQVDLVLDGGRTAGGPASTVADCTTWPPRILREGPIRIRCG